MTLRPLFTHSLTAAALALGLSRRWATPKPHRKSSGRRQQWRGHALDLHGAEWRAFQAFACRRGRRLCWPRLYPGTRRSMT
jgi:hypothetical protein